MCEARGFGHCGQRKCGGSPQWARSGFGERCAERRNQPGKLCHETSLAPCAGRPARWRGAPAGGRVTARASGGPGGLLATAAAHLRRPPAVLGAAVRRGAVDAAAPRARRIDVVSCCTPASTAADRDRARRQKPLKRVRSCAAVALAPSKAGLCQSTVAQARFTALGI